MSTTLRDIAERASVSASTVSRVLNNYPYVDDKTRQTVLEAAEALGYPRTNLRKSTGALRTVLLLVRLQQQESALTGDRNGSIETGLAGIERAIAVGARSIFDEKGITTRVEHTLMDPAQTLSDVHDPSVIGQILAGGMVDGDFLRTLQAEEIPFVVAGSHARPLSINCVMADYRGGVEQAVAHLVARGCRRIGLVNGSTVTTSSLEKYKGLRTALAEYGLDFSPQRVVYADFTMESGHQQTLALLAQAPELDAIVFGDDNIATGGLRALRELGRHVPDDIRITGFHNYDIAQFVDPPLTTVEFDMNALGAVAAQRLCQMIDGPDDVPWTIVLPTRLIVRESA